MYLTAHINSYYVLYQVTLIDPHAMIFRLKEICLLCFLKFLLNNWSDDHRARFDDVHYANNYTSSDDGNKQLSRTNFTS